MKVHSERDDARVTDLALKAGRGDRAALTEFIKSTQDDVWRLLAQEYTVTEIMGVLHLEREACYTRIKCVRRRFRRFYEQAAQEGRGA